MIREEIKKAAEDGKTKLQFPTGETAMKIEGLGQNNRFYSEINGVSTALTKPEQLKVGMTIGDGNTPWMITDVLGDGKFKAVPKDRIITENVDRVGLSDLTKIDTPNGRVAFPENYMEEFDISGKVDTNNPIYKFYEKEVQNYLKKFGGVRVKDANGVEWIEVPIDRSKGGAVEAFGAAPFGVGAILQNVFKKDQVNMEEDKPNLQTMPLLGTPEEEPEAFLKPNPKVVRPSDYSVRNMDISDDDVRELTAILFGEVGNRTGKRALEAQTIINVILNRMQESGKSLIDTVRENKQFQAYLSPQYQKFLSGNLDELDKTKLMEIEEVVQAMLKNKLANNIGSAPFYGHLKDNTIKVYDTWEAYDRDIKAGKIK